MGLAVLEFVIAIEDRSHPHLTDSEAEQIQTVGELYKFLMAQITSEVADENLEHLKPKTNFRSDFGF